MAFLFVKSEPGLGSYAAAEESDSFEKEPGANAGVWQQRWFCCQKTIECRFFIAEKRFE